LQLSGAGSGEAALSEPSSFVRGVKVRSVLVPAALAIFAGACSGEESDAPAKRVRPTPAPEGAPWETLEEWHLFADAVAQRPADGVVPFDVISVLFADYSEKLRFLWLPPDTKIGWSDTDRWEVPVGAIVVKTFLFPADQRDPAAGRRLLETRLLIHETERWVGHTYVWDEAQRQAMLKIAGDTLDVSYLDLDGQSVQQRYDVPNEAQCQECHGIGPEMRLLGPRTRQLDRDHDYGKGPENQIDHMTKLGLFDVTPPATRARLEDPLGQGPLVERVRAYLDVNCAHCHGETGLAHSTGFWLDYAHTDPATGDPTNWGVCKLPTSAGAASGGLNYDVVPGKPDESIIVYRVASI
jgi:uncharacterized repeat protein (TIGR03806 family)